MFLFNVLFPFFFLPTCLFICLQILVRLSKLCVQNKKCRNQQQRLLKNMGAHLVVLDLLQIPYEKVGLMVLMVKDMTSVKGRSQKISESIWKILHAKFCELWYNYKIMMDFSPLILMRSGSSLSMTLHKMCFIRS